MYGVIFCTLIVLPVMSSFSYTDCPITGGQYFDSNGYQIIAAADIDLTTTASNSLYSSATTYQTILDAATLEMKTCLTNYAASGDVAYNTILQYVPFHVTLGTDTEWFFFYSGECATSASTSANSYNSGGCVASLTFPSLIISISGTWLLHEYAHVYHLAFDLTTCSQTIALTSAYENSVNNKTAILAANGDVTDYYAWSNEMEYFAELSEAYFAVAPDVTDSGDWPRDRAQLIAQDPQGYDAVRDLWMMTQAEVDSCMAGCTPQSDGNTYNYDDDFTGMGTTMIIGISVGAFVVITSAVVLAVYIIFYKNAGIEVLPQKNYDKSVELTQIDEMEKMVDQEDNDHHLHEDATVAEVEKENGIQI